MEQVLWYRARTSTKDRSIRFYNVDKFQDDVVKNWPNMDILVGVKKYQEKKTQDQLGYYYTAVLDGAEMGFEELGYRMTRMQARAELEERSPIMKESYVVGKEMKERIKRLSELNKKELSSHIDWCIQFCSEVLGVVVAEPLKAKPLIR